MVKLLKLLKETSSTNEKVEILRRYANDKVVTEAIRLCYDAFILSYMKKVPKPNRVGTMSFRDNFAKFYGLFINLSGRTITGNAAKEKVQSFLEECDADAQDIFTRILQKDLKVNIAEKMVNQAYGDGFVTIFTVQRGEKYDGGKNYKNIDSWFASPKMDGLRGLYEEDVLRSRGGHDLKGFDLILGELEDLNRRYGLVMVDGELFSPGVGFQTLQGYITESKNIDSANKEKVKYNIFAIGKQTQWSNTEQMIQTMDRIDWGGYKFIQPVEYIVVPNDQDAIMQTMVDYVDQGYEGAMLRSPNIAWIRKKSNDLLKVKPVLEADFEIIGTFEGKGNIAGTLGGLIVSGAYANKPIISEVGSGFKIKEDGNSYTRDHLWRIRHSLPGKKAEISFQNVTDAPDPKTGAFSLRFPVFNKLKLDRK